MNWSYGGIKLTGKSNVLVDKPGVVPLRPPQIQHGLVRCWNLTSAVRGRELTATARTSKSNGQDFCFVFGDTGSKDSVPKEEEKANTLTEMLGDWGKQVCWCRFAYTSLRVLLLFHYNKMASDLTCIWLYPRVDQTHRLWGL